MSAIIEYVKSKLNAEQSVAALHTQTSSLILAGAGSGKTRTLTYKIAYLLFAQRIPVQHILAVTFTNKAANEMKERLVELTKEMGEINDQWSMLNGEWNSSVIARNEMKWNDEAIQDNTFSLDLPTAGRSPDSDRDQENDAISDFISHIQQTQPTHNNALHFSLYDFKWIGTFHSIFLKILKEDIEALGMKYTKQFGIFDSGESKSVVREILKQMWLQEVFKEPEVKNFISKMKNEGMTPQEFIKRIQTDYDKSMAQIYVEYQKSLENSNMLDFDDLLLLPYVLFSKKSDVLEKRQNQFHYIMVDEAQDTNWIQFELMKMLSGKHANITLIGDDFQSIYGRRGAVMENFLNVKQYWPDIQMFKLQINYRSRPHIVHAGSHIIKNNVNQYQKDLKAHRSGDDKIVCFAHRDEMDEAANTIDLIKKMKGEKFQNWSDIAILYRTNAQSSPFEQILVQEGIPYKIRGAFKFFERKEIKDIVAYIKYIINPRDSVSLKRIINVPGRKIGKTSIDAVEQYAILHNSSLHEALCDIANPAIDIGNAARNNIMDFGKLMDEIRVQWSWLTPAELIEHIAKKIQYRAFLLKEEWGNESAADEKYENIGQLINMAGKYDGVGEETLRLFMEEVTLLTDAAEQNSEQVDSIKLMTVHASKWLEFPFVFIVWLEDQIFPLANATMEPKLLEEERRLMYVAITRAEDHVFLSYAHSRMQRWQTKMNPPSRFIDELPAELLKKYDLAGWWVTANRQAWPIIDEGDTVKHKLFWPGYVLEVWNNLAIVKFYNPKFGVRKIETRFLEII
jgi:DNA helicase-2/ATP-dependent DNA helicase PcrA